MGTARNPPRKRGKSKRIPQMKNLVRKSLKVTVNLRRKKLSPSQKEQKINPWPRNPHLLKSRHLRRNRLRNPLPKKSQQLRNQSMSKILKLNQRKNLPRKRVRRNLSQNLSQNMFLKKENVELHLPEVPFRPKNQKWPKSHQWPRNPHPRSRQLRKLGEQRKRENPENKRLH